jgi:glutaconate CoA-transferase subunit B
MKEYYTTQEFMIWRGAQEIRNHDKVFVGTGLPMLATMYAARTHAPKLIIVFQAGAIGSTLPELPRSVGDPRTIYGSTIVAGLFEMFSFEQRGYIDVGFIGGAECDKYGNINSTSIGDYWNPDVRFPGSGGAGDISCSANKTVLIMQHEKRRFPERVSYLTSPGYFDGKDRRNQVGLVGKGPEAVISNLGVMKFDEETKEMYLAEYAPGITIEQIKESTGFEMDVSRAHEAEIPSEEDVQIIRNLDKEKIFLK